MYATPPGEVMKQNPNLAHIELEPTYENFVTLSSPSASVVRYVETPFIVQQPTDENFDNQNFSELPMLSGINSPVIDVVAGNSIDESLAAAGGSYEPENVFVSFIFNL